MQNAICVNSENKKRNVDLDALRGLAIFLMIMGHVVQKGMLDLNYEGNWIYKAIYSFHMPLLMLISGYLFERSTEKYSLAELYKRKIRQMLVPIVVWNTLYYCMDVLLFNCSEVTYGLIGYVKYLFTGLWFLWAILLYSLLLGFISKAVKKNQLLVVICSFFILLISPNRWRIIFEYVFFIVGYSFGNFYRVSGGGDEKRHVKKICLTITVAVCIIYVCFLDYVRMDISEIAISLLSHNFSVSIMYFAKTIEAYFISACACYTAIQFVVVLKKHSASKKIYLVLVILGRMSLEIYVLQRVIIELVCANVLKNLNICIISNSLSSFALAIIFSILFAMLFILIVKVIQKTKLSFILFGR